MKLDGDVLLTWQRLSKHWSHVGPPLRPAREDVAFAASVLRSLPQYDEVGRLLSILLGVTPELAAILTGTRGLQIEHSIDMINWAMVCHGIGPSTLPVVADWYRLPVPDESADLVMGDGCYSMVSYPDGYARLSREIARALRPGGKCVMRLFVLPDAAETADAVIGDLKRGQIGNFNVLRWRLNMALQPSTAAGVRLADTWKCWNSAQVDMRFLTDDLGWPIETLRVIDAYRDSDTRYTFPTLADARGAISPFLCETACYFPSYEIGDRCPTVVLERI